MSSRSFITLLCLLLHVFAIPLADDDDDDDDDDGCESLPIPSTPAIHVPDSPPAAILAPYQDIPTPHSSPSQLPHATLPVHHRSTSAILGAVFGTAIALVALSLTVRYLIRRHRTAADPFKDPPKPRFAPFQLRRSIASKRRLSDESWVSPPLPSMGSPGSPLSQDFELRRYTCPQRKLVPVTTPVCTPTDTEFGPRVESVIPVPPVRVPAPVYIPPFSPSPSLTSSSSLSPTPSTEPLSSPSPNSARLSRLLFSTFRDTRVAMSPPRPTTAHLIQTTRSYPHAYCPSSATTTSLYAPSTPSGRPSGTQSRVSFYSGSTDGAHAAWERIRDTFATVTTTDTDTAYTPHLHRAMSEFEPSTSPFADPDPGTQSQTPAGTSLGLKLRLSDASEHARYRSRERERERQRQREREERERERAEQRLSTESQTSQSTTSIERSRSLEAQVRKEFKLRDSESVLREFGW